MGSIYVKADNGLLWCFTDTKSRGEAPAQPQLNFLYRVFAAHSRSEHHKDARLAWKEHDEQEKNKTGISNGTIK